MRQNLEKVCAQTIEALTSKPKGKLVHELIQLSLDVCTIATLRVMGVNQSTLFEQLL
jgi:hypothetical protein